MATNLFQRLALATASTTLGLTVVSPLPTTAATVNYDFKFNLDNQPPITGSFNYDDSLIIYYPAQSRNPTSGFPCFLFSSSEQNLPGYCVSGGYSVRQFIDFQINVFGNTFTKNNAESFNLTWERDFPETHGGSTYGPFTSFSGTATWDNPYLSLAFFNPPGPFGIFGSFSIDVRNPASYPNFPNQFGISESSFTLQNIEPPSVPEGRQELALLSLGILGIASLLKKKIASSQDS